MNFFQEFKVADEKTCKQPWCGERSGRLFFCAFCGNQFRPGDRYKAVYTNDIQGAGGNPLTCWTCHEGKTHDEMRKAWVDRCAEYDAPKFRWFSERAKLQ